MAADSNRYYLPQIDFSPVLVSVAVEIDQIIRVGSVVDPESLGALVHRLD